MMEKGPKKQYIEIWPTLFHNDDLMDSQIDNTGKCLVALQPSYPLHYILHPILEENS